MAQKTDSITLKKIDSLITLLDSKDAPGGAISIIHDGKTVYKRYFGMQNLSKRIPVSESTPFHLASISKQFTAMGIALLEEKGKINIHENIGTYFPDFHFPDSITIKNLVDHSSGIRESTVIAVLAGHVNLKGELPKRLNNKTFLFSILNKEKDLNFPTGSEMAYTNINYVLLAEIIEKTSGMRFDKFIDSAIFKPLKMKNSYIEDFINYAPTVGYQFNGKKFKNRNLRGGTHGDDNMISTLGDLEIWSNNFIDNRLGSKKQGLIKKISSPSTLDNGKSSNYGYGLVIGEYRGMKTVFHDGENDLHTSFIFNIPEKKTSIIFLVNSTNYINPIKKTYEIVDLLFPTPNAVLAISKNKKLSFKTVAPTELDKKTGLYYNIDNRGLAQLRKVHLTNGNMAIAPNINSKGRVFRSINKNRYISYNSSGYPIEVIFQPDQNENSFVERYTEGPYKRADIAFQKIDSIAINFTEYSGTYQEVDHKAKIKVREKKGRIYAKKSILKIPLIQLETDKFYSTDYNTLFIFNRDTYNKVKSLKINSWDFRNFNLIKKGPFN